MLVSVNLTKEKVLSMKLHTRGITYVTAFAAMFFCGIAAAQSASGTSATNCTQSGTTVSCSTTTTFQLPSSINLQSGAGVSSFTIGTGSSTPVAPSGCSITPSSPTVSIGATTTLSVACAAGSGGYSYGWTRGGAAVGNNSSTYTVTSADTASVGATNYAVSISNSAGSTSASTNVTVGTVTLTAPSSCSITPAASTVTTGATPTLTVTCAGGAVATYSWTKDGAAVGGNASTYTLTASDTAAAGIATYGVTASNTAGSTQASTTLTVTAGAYVAQNFCPGGQTQSANLDASSLYARFDSTNLLGTSTNYIVKVNVPTTGASTAGRLPVLVSHVEAPSNQRGFRTVTISKNLCDYTASANTYVLANFSAGSSTEVTVDNPRGGYPNLTIGTWYINVKNNTGGCPANQFCNVALEWSNY